MSLSFYSYIFVGIEKGFWESSSDDDEHNDDVANANGSDTVANESKRNVELNSVLKSVNTDGSANCDSEPNEVASEVAQLNGRLTQQVSRFLPYSMCMWSCV